MKLFACPKCGATLFFRNLECACGAQVVFDPEAGKFSVDRDPCANREKIRCNFAAEEAGGLCRACQLSTVIPDTEHGDNLELWAVAESAKRWVMVNLHRWGWFTGDDPGMRPNFHLLSEETSEGTTYVTMGHAGGVVTINVTESNPAERIARREDLGERLRTMIGHFRHELAHFFFERLSEKEGFLVAFRELFGDERADYGAALKRHYADGPPEGWREHHITAYASSHPHEDWAESFAHVMHLTDIVDSFVATGLSSPEIPSADYDAYTERDSERLINLGTHLGIALNHTNRAMGLQDIYPFILNDITRAKLVFVHEQIGPQASDPPADPAASKDPTEAPTEPLMQPPIEAANGHSHPVEKE